MDASAVPQALIRPLVRLGHDFHTINGSLVFDRSQNGASKPVPYTLLPQPTPRDVYNKMFNTHPLMQELYVKVSANVPFLLQSLKPLAEFDPYLSIFTSIVELRDHMQLKQDPVCTINRSDFMLDETHNTDSPSQITYTPLQVEFNAVSTGLSALAQRLSQFHDYQASQLPLQTAAFTDPSQNLQSLQLFTQDNLPPPIEQQGGAGSAKVFNVGINYMKSVYPTVHQKWVVLMVIQKNEFNIGDQKLIEFALQVNHNIAIQRATLDEIAQHVVYKDVISGDVKNQEEFYNHFQQRYQNPSDEHGAHYIPFWKGIVPIGVVYYRSCYTPRDFELDLDTPQPLTTPSLLSEEESPSQPATSHPARNDFFLFDWITSHYHHQHFFSPNSQQLIKSYFCLELSNAIKCPNTNTLLSGMKKIQQLLTQKHHLANFLNNDVAKIDTLSSLFTDMYQLQHIGELCQTPQTDLKNELSTNTTSPSTLRETAGAISDALQYPERYVLKPMREGGGNNVYGNQLREKLQAAQLSAYLTHCFESRGDLPPHVVQLQTVGLTQDVIDARQDLAAMVLMKKIVTNPNLKHIMVTGRDSYTTQPSVAEYGVFGSFFATIEDGVVNIVHLDTYGTLVRVKSSESNEGGLAIGTACLSSIIVEP